MTRRVSLSFMRLALGLFFFALGFAGILPDAGRTAFSLNGGSQTLAVIFGIVELVCGAYLALGFFVTLGRRGSFYASLIVLLFWLARIALTKIVWGLDISDRGIVFHGGFLAWMLMLSCELVIASALGILLKANDER